MGNRATRRRVEIGFEAGRVLGSWLSGTSLSGEAAKTGQILIDRKLQSLVE